MRKMKDSGIEWIGQIPENWGIVRVKQAFIRKNEKAQQEDPVVLSLARSGVKVRDVSNNEGQVAESYYNYNPVCVGDLLLNPMDLYSGANCSISEVEGVISPAYVNLRSRNDYNARFYDYYFKVQYWTMVLFAHGKGVSFDNRWTLNHETLMNFPVVAPPLSVQASIADYLDEKCEEIDRYIEKQQQIIEKLKAYKQAIITEAVTKGLDHSVPMKDSGIEWIGEIPAEWESTILKRHCSFQTGSTPSTKNEAWFDGTLDWFMPGDFHDGYYLCESARKLSLLAQEEGVATIIPANTVMIIGIGGTAGKIGFTTKECSCNQQITAIKSDIKIDDKYLMYWMIANTEKIKDTALYTTLPIINNQTIGQYTLIVPSSRQEQMEIVEYLDKKCAGIDDLIISKKQLVSEFETYIKSLIFECVTGKKEV